MVGSNRSLYLFFFARVFIVVMCISVVFLHFRRGAAASSEISETAKIEESVDLPAEKPKGDIPNPSEHISITGIPVIESDITGVRNYEKTYPPLIEAAYTSLYDDVKKLLESGADPNIRAFDGCTAVNYLCRNGDDTDSMKILDLLIAYGARARIEDIAGYTPLHVVPTMQIFERRNYCWEVLVKNGALIDSVTRMVEGSTRIDNSPKFRSYSVFEVLVDNYDRLGVIDALIQWGWLASKEIRIRARARAYDIGLRDIAEEFDKYEILLNGFKGIAFDAVVQRQLNAFGLYEGLTPVEYPGEYGKITIDGGISVLLYRGLTPLMMAVLKKDEVLIEDILKKEPYQLKIKSQDMYERTALHLAVIQRQSDAIKPLLAAGSSIDAGDWQGNTPLHIVAWLGNIASQKKLTTLLVGNGATFTIVNKVGETVLHRAVRLRDFEYVEYLLENYRKQLDLNQQNRDGLTAYTLAEKLGLREIMRLLKKE